MGSSGRQQVWTWRLAAAGVLAVPLLVPEPPWRVVVAFWAMAACGRALQVSRAPAHFRPGERLLAFLLLVDPRPSARGGRPTPWWELPRGLLWVGVGCGLFGACTLTEVAALRTAAGGLAIMACATGLDGALRAVLSRFGLHYPSFQCAPLQARSLAEFWGQRWNRVVGGYLREVCYVPAARRAGRTAGLVASFGASALLHAFPLALTTGATGALSMVAFFGLHGLAVGLESRLGWARLVTWGVLGATAPLFVLPLLRALGL